MRQVAVVVGVGPGLGAALVRAFANEGYRGRRGGALDIGICRGSTSATMLARSCRSTCDATEPADVERVFDAAAALGSTGSRDLQRRRLRPREHPRNGSRGVRALLGESEALAGFLVGARGRAPDDRARLGHDSLHRCHCVAARWRGLRELGARRNSACARSRRAWLASSAQRHPRRARRHRRPDSLGALRALARRARTGLAARARRDRGVVSRAAPAAPQRVDSRARPPTLVARSSRHERCSASVSIG